MTNHTFAVIGGDYRIVMMANELSYRGNRVNVFGFDENVEFAGSVQHADTLADAVSDVEYVILPLPCATDGKHINTTLYSGKITFEELLSKLDQTQKLFVGRIDAKLDELAQRYGIEYFDYFEREEMSVRNCIPTAEGAIEIALRELPITLHGSRTLVLGFGRVAKTLAHMLNGIGADVTVEARKFSDLAWVEAYGYQGIKLADLGCYIGNYDVIFNTIPVTVLDQQLLKRVNPECLIIDLASKPGGVDMAAAQHLGLNVIWALSLPGKVAPKTAGNIIKDTILNMIHETEAKA